MLVTLSGIETPVKPVQFWKASRSMLVPLVIITTNEVGLACFATELVFAAEPVMLVKPVQPEKAPLSMFVMLSGIVMLVSPLQPSKTE